MVKDRSDFSKPKLAKKTNVLPNGFTKPEGENYEFVDGELLIDFNEPSNEDKAELHMQAKQQLATNDIDLGSGWPKELVWTTKDGRRIPIPQMADSHLLNTIAFLRRRVESVYKKQILRAILKSVIRSTAYSMTPLDLFNNTEVYDDVTSYIHELKAEALEMGKSVIAMDADTFLRTYSLQFPHLYQEAYKRKLLLEVDSSKIDSR